jgi:hypothetical protein
MKLNQYSYESDKQEVTPVITKDEEDNNKLLETRISLYQLKKQLESNEGITET